MKKITGMAAAVLLSLSHANAMDLKSLCQRIFSRASAQEPLQYAQQIERQGFQHVQVNHDNIARVADVLSKSDYRIGMATWDFPPYPDTTTSFNSMFAYFLVLDSINYMYFEVETGQVFSKGASVGAGLVAERLTAHWQEISRPGYLANLTEATAAQLFKADVPLPALQKRVAHLRAVGAFLDAHHGENWSQWLQQFPRALDLALYIRRNIAGFDDPFVKRAQLFVGMLVGRFSARPELPAGMKNLSGMTVYADYILPMVMYRMGVLQYSKDLETHIRNGDIVPAGSREENEIRAATLIAAQQLLQALNATERYKTQPLSILALDAALWLQGGEVRFPGSEMPAAVFVNGEIPHHKTVTTYY